MARLIVKAKRRKIYFYDTKRGIRAYLAGKGGALVCFASKPHYAPFICPTVYSRDAAAWGGRLFELIGPRPKEWEGLL